MQDVHQSDPPEPRNCNLILNSHHQLVTTPKRPRGATPSSTPALKKSKSSGGSSLELPISARETLEGRVFVFGTGDCAQLGLGEDILLRKKPANLAALNDHHIVDIAAGGMHNMALSSSGKVRTTLRGKKRRSERVSLPIAPSMACVRKIGTFRVTHTKILFSLS
jgi:hypothetical protein